MNSSKPTRTALKDAKFEAGNFNCIHDILRSPTRDILQYPNTPLLTLLLLSIRALLSVTYWEELLMLHLEGRISLSVVSRTKTSTTPMKTSLGQVRPSNLRVWSAVTKHIWVKDCILIRHLLDLWKSIVLDKVVVASRVMFLVRLGTTSR